MDGGQKYVMIVSFNHKLVDIESQNCLLIYDIIILSEQLNNLI